MAPAHMRINLLTSPSALADCSEISVARARRTETHCQAAS